MNIALQRLTEEQIDSLRMALVAVGERVKSLFANEITVDRFEPSVKDEEYGHIPGLTLSEVKTKRPLWIFSVIYKDTLVAIDVCYPAASRETEIRCTVFDRRIAFVVKEEIGSILPHLNIRVNFFEVAACR